MTVTPARFLQRLIRSYSTCISELDWGRTTLIIHLEWIYEHRIPKIMQKVSLEKPGRWNRRLLIYWSNENLDLLFPPVVQVSSKGRHLLQLVVAVVNGVVARPTLPFVVSKTE